LARAFFCRRAWPDSGARAPPNRDATAGGKPEIGCICIALKVDLIVRKNSEYRHAEFERRKSVEFAGISTWFASREDLILSKLVWARDTVSETQLRNVRTLIDESVDWPYLKDWAAKLGVAAKLDELSK
jgi:hypothetical protein